MTLNETLLQNAKAELELAILYGNIERELEMLRTIAEIEGEHTASVNDWIVRGEKGEE